MLTGLYAAASGLDAQERRQEAVASNLANASTPAYKRQVVAVESFDRALGLVQARSVRDQAQGAPLETGRALDVALDGPGHLVVETAAGRRYTRAGHLVTDAAGRLVTPQGQPVLGQDGPISLADVGPDAVRVDGTGRLLAGGRELGRLRLVEVDGLASAGDGLLRAPEGAAERPSAATRVLGGHLERSNVDPVVELVTMIGVQRSFEAASRAVQQANEALGRTASELR